MGKPGMLQSMGPQDSDLTVQLNLTEQIESVFVFLLWGTHHTDKYLQHGEVLNEPNEKLVFVDQPYLFVTSWTICSLLGSSVYGIVLARILVWVAFPSCRGSSRPRDQI